MQWSDRLKLRLRTLFRRQQVERELHREMEFHLQEQIAENLARGMSPEAARNAALRKIGGMTQIEEQCRDQRGLHLIETTSQDVRYAMRSLRSTPGFTVIAVLSLALGVGANIAIFSLIDSIILNSLPVKDPQQLVFVRTNQVKVGNFMVSRTIVNRDFQQIQEHATQIDGIATEMPEARLSVAVGNHAELAPGDFVSGSYFQVLQVQAELGRTINPSDDSPTGNAGGTGWAAMISDGYWQRRFGRDPGAIGQRITVNTVPFVVVGVMPRTFAGLSIDQSADIVVPSIMSNQVYGGSASAGFPGLDDPAGSTMIARIKKGASQNKAAAELTVIFRASELSQSGLSAAQREQIQKRSIEFEPAARGSSMLRRRFSEPLLALMAVVALVMLIACANIASLLLAKASARQKEIAIRLSLGSSRKRIVRQLLTESLILSALGCTAGILFALVARDVTLKLGAGAAKASILTLNWDFRLLFFITSVCVLNAVLFGIVPALRATNVDPNEVLKGTQSTQHSARLPFGRLLVTAQLAVSLALVVGAGLFLGSLRNLYGVDLGFDHENLLMATLDPHLIGFDNPRTFAVYKQILDDVKALPSVTTATLMHNRLFSGRAFLTSARVPGYVPQPGEDLSNTFTLTYGVGARIFETLRMPLLEGRDFSETDNEKAQRVVIINQAMADHYFRGRDPIGQQITFGPDKTKATEIIGIARNAHYFDVQDEKQDAIFTPLLQVELKDFGSEETLLVRTKAKPEQVANDIRAVVRRIDPNLPLFDITTMAVQVQNDLSTPRLMATLSSFFGLLALTLSAIGLYGVLAYGVTKRTGEIGIRMALGADRSSILKLILGETGQLLLIGVAAGLALSWVASRLVKSMLYGLSAHDARVFAVGALVLVIVALGAAMLPARRAVRVEPMVALRYE